MAGLNKILSPAQTQGMIEAVRLAPVTLVYAATIILELGAGLLLGLGGRLSAPAAIALAVLCVATDLVFHRFWELEGTVAELRLLLFFKNIAIASALLYAAASEWTGHRRMADG